MYLFHQNKSSLEFNSVDWHKQKKMYRYKYNSFETLETKTLFYEQPKLKKWYIIKINNCEYQYQAHSERKMWRKIIEFKSI